jgi:RNA polymerase sigma factor (sigma-70 family)
MNQFEENVKKNVINEVLKELKSKNLLKNHNKKSAYKSTEKLLYCLNVLPEAVRLIDSEVKQLEEEAKSIPTPKSKSNTLVLKEQGSTYTYGEETLETRISELKQISAKAKSEIRLVKNALAKISSEKYYVIIPYYYFRKMTIEDIAETLHCSTGTISTNKKDLIDKLKVYIFPDAFIDEL